MQALNSQPDLFDLFSPPVIVSTLIGSGQAAGVLAAKAKSFFFSLSRTGKEPFHKSLKFSPTILPSSPNLLSKKISSLNCCRFTLTLEIKIS